MILGAMAGALASFSVRADEPIPLALVISRSEAANHPALAMSLTFRGAASGETIVHLPAEWASEKELWRGLKSLTVKNANFASPIAEPQTRRLTHAPSAQITLAWDIVQDYDGEPNFADAKSLFRPTVNAHVVIAALQTILPSLEIAPGRVLGLDPHPRTAPPLFCDITISFEKFPKNWALATAFGASASQSAHALRCDALWDSNLALGDFRVREAKDAHGIVRLAVRGKWALSDEALLAKFSRARAAAAEVFQDPGPPQILISLAGTAALARGQAVFGTAFSYGFFGFATPNASPASLKVWWNHEQVHYWIPNRLGQGPEGAEAALAWFNEGFTDYFSLMNAYRTHELDAKSLAEEVNTRFIAAYLKSPVREAPNAKIVEGFWSDHTLQQLPYQRGALLALNWNAEIKKGSNNKQSLADLIAELIEQARQNPNVVLTPSRVAEAARTSGVANAAADIASYIDAGHLITPREDIFGPCTRYDQAKGVLVMSGDGWTTAGCSAWLK
jgi:hypothetical protein